MARFVGTWTARVEIEAESEAEAVDLLLAHEALPRFVVELLDIEYEIEEARDDE